MWRRQTATVRRTETVRGEQVASLEQTTRSVPKLEGRTTLGASCRKDQAEPEGAIHLDPASLGSCVMRSERLGVTTAFAAFTLGAAAASFGEDPPPGGEDKC